MNIQEKEKIDFLLIDAQILDKLTIQRNVSTGLFDITLETQKQQTINEGHYVRIETTEWKREIENRKIESVTIKFGEGFYDE